jgi:hypothetical protein
VSPAPVDLRNRARSVSFAAGLLAVAIVSLPMVAWPYVADSRFHEALTMLMSGDRGRAIALVQEARAAQPQEPV